MTINSNKLMTVNITIPKKIIICFIDHLLAQFLIYSKSYYMSTLMYQKHVLCKYNFLDIRYSWNSHSLLHSQAYILRFQVRFRLLWIKDTIHHSFCHSHWLLSPFHSKFELHFFTMKFTLKITWNMFYYCCCFIYSFNHVKHLRLDS